MDSQQATAWLSEPRFRPFQDATKGDHDAAVALYVWHPELTAVCFGVVQNFEVILRNSIDQTLADGQGQQPLKDTWLMDFDTLQPGGIKQVITAVDVVAFTEAIDKVEGTGTWAAGTVGAVVSDYGTMKEVEISDDRGIALDSPVVPVKKLKLVSKHSDRIAAKPIRATRQKKRRKTQRATASSSSVA